MFKLTTTKHIVYICPNYCLYSVFLDKYKLQSNKRGHRDSTESPTGLSSVETDVSCLLGSSLLTVFLASFHVSLVGGTETQGKVMETWMQLQELRSTY